MKQRLQSWVDATVPYDLLIIGLDEIAGYFPDVSVVLGKIDILLKAMSSLDIDYYASTAEQVFTEVHFFTESKFNLTGLGSRAGEISLPGIEYHLQRQALNELSRSGRKVVSKRLFNLYRLANRVGLSVFARYLLVRLLNIAFQISLGSTNFIYNARGVFGIPIRKYFEIPAAGTYLICSPSNGFAELGFAEGVHYLKAEPEELFRW